jgi:uncharacterized protein YyaL (SSP411 family)
MRDHPSGFATLLLALEEQLEPPATAILRGAADALIPWTRAMAREYLPGILILAIPAGMPGLPPVLDKPAGKAVNAWLCRGVVCLPVITGLDALRKACKESAFG